MSWQRTVIGAGFRALSVTGLHRLTPPRFRGRGVILTLHRVRPWRPATPGYAPNALLEITPEFLDAALARVRALGFEFAAVSEIPERLADGGARFCAITFDDGYRDFLVHALPALERHGAPATLFLCPGMIEGGAQPWWLQLEEAIRRLDEVDGLRTQTGDEKSRAYDRLYWRLRALPETELLAAAAELAARARVSDAELREGLFLDWPALQALARRPRLDFGAHGMRHLRLAQWPADVVREEMARSRAAIAARLGRTVSTFCYPVGDRTSAARREFELARELGFAVAVTTRPGLLFAEHAEHLTALPRVSVNGLWQDEAYLDILLGGGALALWNRGRRLDVE